MPGIDFKAIRRLVSIREVLDLIGWVPVNDRKMERRGPCPVHRSASPRSRSFAASPLGWYCHKCCARGDALDLYAQVRGLNVYPAALELCRRLGRAVPWLPRGPRGPRRL
jgi:hypothetical protein